MDLSNKTRADALHFADTIENSDDRELFIDLFDRGEFDTIKGHFPAFYGDANDSGAVLSEVAASNGDITQAQIETVVKPKATLKPKKVK